MPDKKIDLIKGFSKIFKQRDSTIQEDCLELLKEGEFRLYTDNTNCIGIVPKRKSVKDFLVANYEADEKEFKKESFDYSISDSDLKAGEIVSNYSGEFLKLLLELAKSHDRVILKMKKDYPLWIETDDLICIIAPKVYNED